jgi:anti-sigma-K factor RskA
MSNHLSEDQFEACVLERAGRAELEHLNECAECRAEFERFGKALSLFRSAVWDLVDDRSARTSRVASKPASIGIPMWRWALAVAAFVAAVAIPILVTENQPPQQVEQMSPEAVMERLNRHLARTVPAPMEPMMSLISDEQFTNEPGGVQ